MARLYVCGFELQTVTAGMEWTTTTNSPTIDTTTKRSGAAAMRCNTSATTAYIQHDYADSTTIKLARIYVRIASAPSAITDILMLGDNADSYVARIRMNTDRTLELWSDSAQVGSDSSALALDTWYRVELSYDDANSDAVVARIDGTNFATGTGGDNGGNGRFRIGVCTSVTADLYFDDIGINDSSGTSETSWPGSEKLVLALPTGAGDSAATTGDYSMINEIPPSNTATSGSTMIELDNNPTNGEYAMTDSSTLGIAAGDQIKLISVLARMREETAGTSNYNLRIKSASGGTTTVSSSGDAGDATTVRTNPVSTTAFARIFVSYIDPTTFLPWTPTGTNSIDNMQVGVGTTDGTPDTWCLWLGAYIAYRETPTVTLNSPADASSDSDTTPTVDFTGTSPEGNSIEYEVQIDTVNTFDSQL